MCAQVINLTVGDINQEEHKTKTMKHADACAGHQSKIDDKYTKFQEKSEKIKRENKGD